MDKFDEKLYHLLSEYHPEHKDTKLSHKAKFAYMTRLSLYLASFNVDKDWYNINWYDAFMNKLLEVGVERDFADALTIIRDDWELTDLD